ncbi:MAG: chorismate synthase [Alphaproteobacteria bacterium]|jgi:chorismate synthase|nr:chorismate synthase [Alphaproteobacteria bacterium]
MTGNSFGHSFRFTTFGESHGPAIGVVVDGVPPRLPLTEAAIQPFLDARAPGRSRHTTQRREKDQVEILSGVYEGRTTGTPIALLIRNTDQRSKDYAAIEALFRPGHADWTYREKYGIRDPRGGGRSSARETACRVAVGAVARLVIPHVTVRACVTQIGHHRTEARDWAFAATNPLFCPDPAALETWEAFLDETRKRGSSAGAVVEVVAVGVPSGLGAPVYDRLDADIAKALMSINAVKAVEIGAGFAGAALSGEDNADEMLPGPVFASNNAGGILGGISTGQDIVARAAFKPTSSIRIPRRTIDMEGQAAEISTTGRHDPCVGIRGAPVVEAMVACVLADHLLRHRAQCGGT